MELIWVCWQRVNLGHRYAGQTVTVAVSETTLVIEFGDGETRTVARTTTLSVPNVKAFRRPRSSTRAEGGP